ncbi:DUF982 domain-containing protein [Phyllobacterium bourgognense]|uniref:Uncharacterized protein DUF982 n=1 Tax=Phyllobacterium bourgognense TaxID=314236 RepID=A0A368YDT6_9HYPH|nr:DUF982 domain-containing protein [Phyllobacterium bourgognense]RCW77578.1 uncharacterized protein DUF982 [Phyllobacterium bourgognense]
MFYFCRIAIARSLMAEAILNRIGSHALDALDQLTTVTDARAAFIEAAREANIFVDYRSATI